MPASSTIEFRVIEADKRPVAAVADAFEVRDVARVVVRESRAHHCTIMFDPEHNLFLLQEGGDGWQLVEYP